MEILFRCFSFKLMKYLVAKDYMPCGQKQDLKNENRQIWIFKNSDELQIDFHKYQNMNK